MANRYKFTKSFQNEVCKVLSRKYGLSVKGEKDISGEIKAPVDLYYQDEMGEEYLVELEIHRSEQHLIASPTCLVVCERTLGIS